MVKKSDLYNLFHSIKNINTEPNSQTIQGWGIAVGKAKMKNEVLLLMQDWYATFNHGSGK